MTREYGINQARPILGDLVTAVQQGADIILTRNGKPAARIVRYEESEQIVEQQMHKSVNEVPEPGRGATVRVHLGPEYDGEEPREIILENVGNRHPCAAVTPADLLSNYDINSARWLCDDLWDRLLSWQGLEAIEGYRGFDVLDEGAPGAPTADADAGESAEAVWYNPDDFGNCARCGEEYTPAEMVYDAPEGPIGECCGR